MKRLALAVGLTAALSGCDTAMSHHGLWHPIIYPDRDSFLVTVLAGGQVSEEACHDYAQAQLELYPGGTYSCGYNCEWDPEWGLFECEKLWRDWLGRYSQ